MALTEGTPTSISPAADQIRIRKLDTDKALVIYREATVIQGRVIDISGGSISAGAENDIWSGDYLVDPDIWVISPTKAVVFGQDVSTLDPQIRTLTISGTTITENTAATVESLSGSSRHFLAMISTTVGIAFYNDGGDSRLCRFTISGDTITPGTPEDQEGPGTSNVPYGACQLDSSRVVIFYSTPTTNNAMVQVIDISSSISKGTAVQLDTNSDINNDQTWLSCQKVDTDKIIVVWKDINATPDEISAIIATTSGTAISGQGTRFVIRSDNASESLGVDVLNTTTAIVAWVDDGSTAAKIQTLNISGTTITSNADTVTTATQPVLGGASEHGLANVDTGQTIFAIADSSAAEVWVSIIGGANYGWQHSATGIPGSVI